MKSSCGFTARVREEAFRQLTRLVRACTCWQKGGNTIAWDFSRIRSPRPFPCRARTAAHTADVAAYTQQYGPVKPVAMLGGSGADTIRGSAGDDLLAGGVGNDTVFGGLGADHFLITSPADGHDVLADFSSTDRDVLELRNVFSGSLDLRDHLRLTYESSGAKLALDLDGIGADGDLVITLGGWKAADGDLFTLYHTGRLVVPGFTLPSAVSIVATLATTSENGPPPGAFTLTRLGPLTEPLAVTLSISGSATNGTDYAAIPTSVVIPAGSATLEILLIPYADALAEPAEVAQINLEAGAGYIVRGAPSVQVTITDLLPEITLEAIEPLAVANTGSPGVILLTRTGVVDRSVLVRLKVEGNAAPGSDYAKLPAFINLAANQTTALLQVQPSASPVISNDAESIHVSVLANAAYRLGDPAQATVMLVPAEQWLPQAASGTASGNDVLAELCVLRNAAGQPAPGNPLRLRDAGGHLAIEFLRNHAARDLRYVVEVSDDLRTWASGKGVVEETTPPGAERRASFALARRASARREPTAIHPRPR